MEADEGVKAAKIRQFWDSYRACVEAFNVLPERSGHNVHWVQEFVGFQPGSKTEKTYLVWTRRFIAFHDFADPRLLLPGEGLKEYLDYLAGVR